MYWRRFAISSIPLGDSEKFDVWIRQRWTEKDELLEQYVSTGRFPSSEIFASAHPSGKGASNNGFIETKVRPKHWWEVSQIFSVLATLAVLAHLGGRIWNMILYGKAVG